MNKNILNEDQLLQNEIQRLIEKNDLLDIQGADHDRIIQSFLKLTFEQRKELISWYEDNRWVETKTISTRIDKSNFESTHFYVSGSDVAVAMMLLGFSLNSSRETNVSEKSMNKLSSKKVSSWN